MKRIDLVKIYNLLSWYFCNSIYKKHEIKTKLTDSCETLINELTKIQKEIKK